jgi:hypothetical protein
MFSFLKGCILVVTIFLTVSITGNAQSVKTYSAEWKKVEELYK